MSDARASRDAVMEQLGRAVRGLSSKAAAPIKESGYLPGRNSLEVEVIACLKALLSEQTEYTPLTRAAYQTLRRAEKAWRK